MEKETMYQIVDLFMAGVPASEIAATSKLTTIEVLTLLQGSDAQLYADQVRQLRKLELEALADGPALDAMREGVQGGVMKERLQAADMINKASGRYQREDSTVATLAEILKRVMEEAKDG